MGLASYDTRFPDLQARPDAGSGRGNTGNPRVFILHAVTQLGRNARTPARALVAATSPGNAARVEEGELSVFAKDLEAAIPALRRYARALTRDAETADDLVQDTLVRALRSEHLFHGGDVRSWLYTILTNLNRNRLRSLARRPALSPLGDADAPQMAGPEAGGRDIERALAALVEDQRSALLLVVLEGLSYREVAEVQGVPIGTVMSRLARARAQIRSYLDGERPALRRVK
jgi:RNA polymerase sigma-70 factor (ECF subfamily)